MVEKQNTMLGGQPGTVLIRFALPMILGNLFQQCYNMADSAVVGRFVGEQALAAVGASYAITNVFIAVAIGGGVGCAVLISQFLGAGQTEKMKTAVSTTLLQFLAAGLVFGVLGMAGSSRLLCSLRVPADVLPEAAAYLRIYFTGLPFLFLYNVQAAVFNALGDSRTPLGLLIFSSLLNIALDLYLVIRVGLGVPGAAYATLAAQGISAVLSFGLLVRKLKGYGGTGGNGTGVSEGEMVEKTEMFRFFDRKVLASMIRVEIPSILQQSIVHLGMLLVQSVINTFGSAVLAGYSAGMRIESLSIVPMQAMGNAMSTFTAQNMGAGNSGRVRAGYRACVAWVFVFAVCICGLLQSFGASWLGFFLDADASRAAMDTALSYVHFISFFFVLIGLKMVSDGVLRGAGDVTVFTIANLANLSVRVFVADYFAPRFGAAFVWYAIPIGWLVNFIISFSWYQTGRWERIRLTGSNLKTTVSKSEKNSCNSGK